MSSFASVLTVGRPYFHIPDESLYLVRSHLLYVVVKPYFIASYLLNFDITYTEACKIILWIHYLDMAFKVYVKLLLHNRDFKIQRRYDNKNVA